MEQKIAIVNQAIVEIKKRPILHVEIIDELYKEHGPSLLEILSAFILVDSDLEKMPHIEKYIDEEIKKLDKQEQLRYDQLILDVDTKKRQAKWFYPLLCITIISFLISVFTTYNAYIKSNQNEQRLQLLESKIKLIELLMPAAKPIINTNKS